MKFTEIRIDRTKSLGNYENLKMGFTVIVDDGENPVAVIEKAERLLDWQINRKERDTQYRKYKDHLAEFADPTTAPAEILEWVAEYERRAAEFATTAGSAPVL